MGRSPPGGAIPTMSTADPDLTRRELLKAGVALGALTSAGLGVAADVRNALAYDEYARHDAVGLAALRGQLAAGRLGRRGGAPPDQVARDARRV